MKALAILIAAGVLTYALRSSMVHLLHRREISPRWSMAFAAAIPAGLAAIIVVSPAAHPGPELLPRTAALAVATVVTRLTSRVSIVIGAGMTTFLVLASQARCAPQDSPSHRRCPRYGASHRSRDQLRA